MELVLKDAQSALQVSETTFGREFNEALVHQVVVAYAAGARQGTRAQKTRSEVSGGGKKPLRQKGTGRARTGSIRNPQWRGGGQAFGPTPRSYAYRINRKIRRLAVRSVLSEKFAAGEILVVDAINLASPKTKDFVVVQEALKVTRNTLYVFNSSEDWENAYLSMRNLPNVLFTTVEGLNLFDMMRVNNIVFTEAAVKEAGEVLA
jgi:large subunit ribosomal protein L4